MSLPTEGSSWTAPYRLVMALRLLRTRKINIISMLGVMLGVAAIIVVMSVMDGFQRELRDMIRGSLSDLIVELDVRQVDSYGKLREAVEAVDGVEAVTLQQHTFGLVNTEAMTPDGGRDNYLPVRIVGILPTEEKKVSRVLELMKHPVDQKGRPLLPENPFELPTDNWAPQDMPRVVVSDYIARRLAGRGGLPFRVGERFTLITPAGGMDAKGKKVHFSDREVVITRTYKTGNSEFDKLHIYVDLRQAKDTLFTSDEGTLAELRVKLTDYSQARQLRRDVHRALAPFDTTLAGLPPEYRIATWEERQRTLLLAVNNEKFLLGFVLFFIIVVACFTIFATLTMTVVEKTREIGVLRALGATPSGVLSIFMLNGTLVGAFGAILGYSGGLYVAHHVEQVRAFLRDQFGWDIFPPEIYLFDEIPTYVDHETATYFAVAAIVCALSFAIIPAVRAARLRPVEALRYE